jgi:small subunit ribosomal protein S1
MIETKNVLNSGFDWDLFEASSQSHLRANNKIKKLKGDSSKVFSRMPYAQDLYDSYVGVQYQISEINVGSVVQGNVVSVNDNFAIVDINWREDAMIDLRKEEPEFLRYIQAGFPIEVIIERIGSHQGSSSKNIIASYSKNILAKKQEELLNSIGEPVAYLGKVTELIHGGYFVDVSGVQCFMPGSLGGMNKLINFEDLIGKSLYVTIINFSKEKNYLVVSHREYLKTLVPDEISKLEWQTEYEGFVTGTSKHGIFVEFNGCLTGLMSRNDILPEFVDDFDNRKIRPGQKLKFYIKEVIDNDKIVLSQKPIQLEPNAWFDIEDRYKVPSIVTGKVKKIVQYGAFIELEPKIVGLLHKSHLNDDFELEVGQEIEVKITRIDKESKKVDFAM